MNLTEEQKSSLFRFKVTFIALTNLAALTFLIINAVIMYTLRSGRVFRETPRYILLLNLVAADSMVLFMGQFMYMHSALSVLLTYPLCGLYIMISYLSVKITPLTLTVMSVERYIAVCFPFSHVTLVTLRNTVLAILGIWAVGSVDILFKVLFLLEFPFHTLPSLQMDNYCNIYELQLGPRSRGYETVSVTVLFLLSGLVIVSSFVSVMVVALSASMDKASAAKARSTLLLHMFQLCLNLVSIIGFPILNSVTAELKDTLLLWQLFVGVYIMVTMMPRCLSSLTYGLNDSSIRPVLVSHLCWPLHRKLTVESPV